MGGIGVHAVGAPRCNDTNFGHRLPGIDQATVFFHVLYRVANLHRTGVRAQQSRGTVGHALDIKRVVHGARGVVLRRVQCGEVEPVGFNLWPLGDIKTHRTKNTLNALQSERYGVQAALPSLATWQRDIQRLGLQLGLQLGLSERFAASVQCRFNGLFGNVDGCAPGFFLFHRELGHALHELGHATSFA